MTNFEKIKGTLVYVMCDRPGHGYKDPTSGVQGEDEWKASVVMTDEEFVDDFKEHIIENKWKLPGIKEVRVSDFEAKFKCPVPELLEAKQKKVWVMTVKRSTKMGKEGTDVPEQYRPKVFMKDAKKGSLVDITHDETKIPANGSMGTISLSLFARTNGTVQVNLKNILVSELIPYVRSGPQASGSEFADDDIPAAAFKSPAVRATAKAKVLSAGVSDFTDDIPF